MQMAMNIEGAEELNAILRQLPEHVARRASIGALRAGAKVIQEDAKRRAPVGPEAFTKTKDYATEARRKSKYGSLRDAIRIKADKYRGGTTRSVVVVVSNKGAGINPHWIEYGTTSTRMAKNGGLMTFVIDGRLIRKRVVAGVRAQPFMRPAADTRAREAIQIIGEYLGREVEKECKRIASGGGKRKVKLA